MTYTEEQKTFLLKLNKLTMEMAIYYNISNLLSVMQLNLVDDDEMTLIYFPTSSMRYLTKPDMKQYEPIKELYNHCERIIRNKYPLFVPFYQFLVSFSEFMSNTHNFDFNISKEYDIDIYSVIKQMNHNIMIIRS